MTGRPLKYKTPEDFQKAVDDAFEQIGLTEAVPTIRYLEYLTGADFEEYEKRKPFCAIVMNARKRAHSLFEQQALSGKIVPKIASMYLCKNLGYVPETQKVDIKAETTVNYSAFDDLLKKARQGDTETIIRGLREAVESNENED